MAGSTIGKSSTIPILYYYRSSLRGYKISASLNVIYSEFVDKYSFVLFEFQLKMNLTLMLLNSTIKKSMTMTLTYIKTTYIIFLEGHENILTSIYKTNQNVTF